MLVDPSGVPVLGDGAQLGTIKHFIVIGRLRRGSLPNAMRYKALLAGRPAEFDYPWLDGRPDQARPLLHKRDNRRSRRSPLPHTVGPDPHRLTVCIADDLGLRSTDRCCRWCRCSTRHMGLAHAAPLAAARTR